MSRPFKLSLHKTALSSLTLIILLALPFTLPGCGGGGGGSAIMPGGGPMVTPGQPQMPEQPETPQPVEPMLNTGLGQITEWRNNPSAQDLLDHWNDPDVLQQGLGAGLVALNSSDRSTRLNTLSSILQTPTDTLDDSKTLLRNVDIGSMTVMGEREGITYGQWKGGPAGTLDIDFDWRFSPNIAPTVRAETERAGKFWSRRLLDDFGTHMITAGTTINSGREEADGVPLTVTYTEDVATDGILATVIHATYAPLSGGGPIAAEITADDYEPWHVQLTLSQKNIDEGQSIGNYWLIHVLGHELGHALGIISHEGGWDVPSTERYINRQDYTFVGPQSVIANGGNPVPYQWLDGSMEVPPHTPGATVDYAHLGVCSSLLAYCNNPREVYQPSEIDFAYLADIGYEVLDAETASEPEIYGYGAWGRYSAWGAGVERVLEYVDDGSDVSSQDQLRAGADAFGIAPATSLSDGFASQGTPQGSVTWSGSLIGVDLGSAHLAPVFGDAAVTVDLTTLEGSADFNNLTVVNNGAASAFRAPNLDYAIAVTGNSFSDSGGRIAGGFFGPAHEEMAGVLRDEAPDVNLLGGFGGAR